MFTKFKQVIEKWLRGIINEEVAAEVSKIDTSLSAERAALVNIFETACVEINDAVDRLSQLSHFKENAALRQHIAEQNGHITQIGDLVKKLHPSVKV